MKPFFLVACLLCLFVTPLLGQSKAAQKAYRKAVSAFNKGEAEAGFAGLHKALRADSTYKQALYATGYYRFQARQYDSARAAFDRLIRLYPADTSFYHYRALTHLYTGRLEAAEQDLKKALSLYANDENTWNDLAYVYYQQDKSRESAEALERSLSIKPSRSAWYYKALLAHSLDDRKAARENVEKALQMDAQYANARRLKAELLAEDGKYTEAAQIYENLLKTGEIEDEDFTDWGLLYYRQKKYEDALHYFTMPDSTDDPDRLYYTGLTQFRLKKYADARNSLEAATRDLDSLDEDNAPIYYDRAIVRFQSGDRSAARRDFFRSVYLMPEIARQKNQAGDTLDLLGNATLLLNRLYTPRQLDSLLLAGYTDRAEAMLEEGEADDVTLTAANQVVKIDSLRPEAYFLRGRVQYFRQDYPAALRDLQQLFALRKNNAGSYEHYWRGLVYSAMDAYDNALRDYDRAIEMDPNEPAYYTDRALVLSVTGAGGKAIGDVNRAIELEKSDDTTYLVLIRASLLNDIGQHGQALKDCETVIARQPNNALAYCTRGYAHLGLNENQQAHSDFAKALALDPDLEEARFGLDELDEK